MIRLINAGYEEIREPDVHRGRKNADFGQGFYMTDNGSFAGRLVREKAGSDIIINTYQLDETDLKIKRFDRDSEWFKYVFSNRRSMADSLLEYDLIIGPIANDTLYDTLGIMTSGFLSDEEALELLSVGPCFTQYALKTLKAAEKLRFLSSSKISNKEAEEGKKLFKTEEEQYLTEFAKVMESFEK